MNLNLRGYQSDLIANVHRSMRAGHKRLIAVMATGGGKTACFAWMAAASQKKGSVIWFVVHRIELLRQTFEAFEKFDLALDNIHIGMVHGFATHPERYPEPNLIIFDECHHSVSATWMKIINKYPDSYIIGLTASPARLDGKPLGDIYTDMVIGADTRSLIESGYLAPYKYYSFQKVDLSMLKKRGGDYVPEDAEKIMMDRAVYGDTIENYRKLADGKQTVCFCTTIKHSQAVAETFREAGYSAVHFDGETPKKEREQIVADYRAGKITILSNVGLISEGFDLDTIDCIIQLRPTASLVLYLQSVGRCLRPKKGKTAIIIDQTGNYLNFGLPADDRNWSLAEKLPQREPYRDDGTLKVRQCDVCYFTFPSGPTHCPQCGAELKKTREEIKNIEEIELKEITEYQRKNKRREEGMAKSYEDLKRIEKQRGYKPGWAYFRAKARGYKS
jgi:superfamily II DNA or RNA helicase